MSGSMRKPLELHVLGLEPRDGRPDADSGFSSPTWTWPSSDAEAGQPLPRLLAGHYVAPPGNAEAAENDCRLDDPDRQALALLESKPPAEIDAITRALGDWRLDGGTRAAFRERVGQWQAAGFTRLLCFDPVHLKAETDHAITLGPRFLGLDAETLDSLLDELNGWLAADGMRVERIGRQLYLLARATAGGVGPAHVDLTRAGAPLACLLNRNAGVFLDERHSEPLLRQWLTEVQMWLYPQPFNDQRAARGEPILNSFWPHGMVELSKGLPAERAETALIISDSPAVLARHDAIVWHGASVEQVARSLESRRSVRVVLTETAWCRLEGDLGGFQRELAGIDAWLSRLLDRTPGLSITLEDGRGGQWQKPGVLARWGRRIAARWRKRA